MGTKSVLITGCSSGIGKATSELLKDNGWEVFATARKPEDIKSLTDSGFAACKLDLQDSSSIKECADYVLSKTQNRLDALVNNAGYGLTCAVEDLKKDTLQKQFQTNLFGLQELTNLIIPVFRKQSHGRIVNISSIVGRFTIPYMGAYCASKFALEALSDALRMELSDTNIHVSVIEPGSIKAKFNKNALNIFEQIENKEKSAHAKAYEIIQKRRDNPTKESTKTPAKAVALKILHALESKKPRARYIITPKAKLVWVAKKILPESFLDILIKIHMKLKKYK